jgi:4-diphosphocytidyl-2-C-methyl-D-erythritol kinase
MIAFPNAKINIGLNVTGRRNDGYHNIETIFYPVKINDVLEIVVADKLSFQTSGIEIPGYANENLCLQAYDLLHEDFDIPPVTIHLHKNIPIGAGLGGGSADAAFFIKLVNDKFNLQLDLNQMESYARKLGADCAFFLHNRPVFAVGKGDELKEVQLNLSSYFLVLVMPHVHVSTGEAYRGVKPVKPEESLATFINFPVSEWKTVIKNDFEDSVLKNHPQIRGVKAALYKAGAVFALMSGSGASVYGIFDKEVVLPDLEKSNKIYYNI